MFRYALVVLSTAIAPVSMTSPAAAQSRSSIQHGGPVVGMYPYFDRATIAPRDVRLSIGQQIQARLWQRVGQCVVDRDRLGSVSYLTASAKSDAAAASLRLKPVFESCLAGSQVEVPASRSLRRAAIADALGVFVPAR